LARPAPANSRMRWRTFFGRFLEDAFTSFHSVSIRAREQRIY
jgi:hypothetical protein